MKHKILFILISLSLFLISSNVHSQVGVDIGFRLGFDGVVKIGRWNPITVTIRTYSVPFKGRAEVEIIEGSIILENIISIKLMSDVDVPIYSKKEVLFLVPLSDVRHPVRVSVLSQDGRIIRSIVYDIKDLSMRLPILCLTGSRSLPYSGSETRVLTLDTESLRNRPFWILDPFDTIVLDYSSSKALRNILDKWMLWGGKIIDEEDRIVTISNKTDTYPGDIDLSPLVLDLINEEVIPLPSKLYASIILLLYLLFFILLFYYSKRHFLRKVLIYILVTLIFSSLLFGITSNVKEKSSVSVQFNIVMSSKAYPYAKVYSALAYFSPYDKLVEFEYNLRDFVFWIGKKGKYLAGTSFILKKENMSANLSLGPNKIGLLRGWGTIDFDIKFSISNGKLRVINKTPFKIRDAYLFHKGRYIPVGDIEGGVNDIKLISQGLSSIEYKGLKGRILLWLKNNGIILLNNKNYILGWIYDTLPGINSNYSNTESLILCLMEI